MSNTDRFGWTDRKQVVILPPGTPTPPLPTSDDTPDVPPESPTTG